MSQIINPERRDPGHIKNKADVGLSKVDNYSAIELQDMIHGALREEYAKGDIYGEKELLAEKSTDLWIPLCNFKDSSSRATITIGFLGRNKKLTSYVRAYVKYSSLTRKELSSRRSGGESPFMAEFETSSKRTLPGGLQVFEGNDRVILYLYLPKDSKKEINGVTINITEDLVTGEGEINHKTLEILDHTKILTESVGEANYSALFSGTDREVSSYSRSLAIYDKDSKELSFPDNFDGEEIDITTLDIPKINGIPFSGDKSLTYSGGSYGNNNLGDITIRAKHSGPTQSESGDHNWEVLSDFPRVSYSKDSYGSSLPEAELSERDSLSSDNGLGLCKLVSIDSKYSWSKTGDSIYSSLNKLRAIVNNTSPNNDEHVVSIGFLRKFTEHLIFILEELIQSDSQQGGSNYIGDVYFVKKDNELSSQNSVSYIELSPNYNHFVEYKFSAKVPTNIKWKFELVGNDGEFLEISHKLEEDGSYTEYYSKSPEIESSGELNKGSIRFKTKQQASPDMLNGSISLGSVNISMCIDEDNNTWKSIGNIPLRLKAIENSDSIFYRWKNGTQYNFSKTLYKAKPGVIPATNPDFSKDFSGDYKGVTLFPNCIKDTSYQTSSGLIWEEIPQKTSYIYRPGVIIPVTTDSSNPYKSIYLKGYTTNPYRISLTYSPPQSTDVDLSVKLYLPNKAGEKIVYEEASGNNNFGETRSIIHGLSSEDIIEESFNYEKILYKDNRAVYTSISSVTGNSTSFSVEGTSLDIYSFIIEISGKAKSSYSKSYFSSSDLGTLSIGDPLGDNSFINFSEISLRSRPDVPTLILGDSDDNKNVYLYRALLDESSTSVAYSAYIPIHKWEDSNFDKNMFYLDDRIPLELRGDWENYLLSNGGNTYKREVVKTKLNVNGTDTSQGWYVHLYSLETTTPSFPESPIDFGITDYIYENLGKISSSESAMWSKSYPLKDLLGDVVGKTSSIDYAGIKDAINPKVNLIRFGGFIHDKWIGAVDYDWWQIPTITSTWGEEPYSSQYDTDMFDEYDYLIIGSESNDSIDGFWQKDNSSGLHNQTLCFRLAIRLNSVPELSDSQLTINAQLLDNKTGNATDVIKASSQQFKWPKVDHDLDNENKIFGSPDINVPYGVIFEWTSDNYFNSSISGDKTCSVTISGDDSFYYLPNDDKDSNCIYDHKTIRFKLVSPKWNWT